MSLINDYFKKSRAAREEQPSASVGVPPVMKSGRSVGPGRGSGKEPPKVSFKTVILLVFMLLAGGVGYFLTMPEPEPEPSAAPPYQEPASPADEVQRSQAANRKALSAEARTGSEKQTQTRVQPAMMTAQAPDQNLLSPQPAALPAENRSSSGLVAEKAAGLAAAGAEARVAGKDVAAESAAVHISSVPVADERPESESKKTAISRVPSAQGKDDLAHLFQAGVLALNAGNYSRARYYFSRVLALDGKYQDALLNLAVISLEQNDFAKARELLARAGRNDPQDARVKVNLGLIALKGSDYEGARKLFADALLLDAGSSSALNNLAWLARKQGDKSAALIYYRNLTALDPHNLKALLAYASCCEQEKDFALACRLYQEALQSHMLENDPALERRIRERIKLLAAYVQ
ncbi:MAG: tetratricopeptide repeat protein [Deltaproteobacteria bacterium]|nr:tetratricopeptide repeat protein [Deltaproteobacteria bacterium]